MLAGRRDHGGFKSLGKTLRRIGLPVRGQRTKTNARTRKGARKTIGAVRDKAARGK